VRVARDAGVYKASVVSEPPAPYPRDLRGYGADPPHPRWPGGARIALQFVLNYEEGGENSVLHGDPASETFLSELVTAQAYPDRHLTIESMYEYGSRAGVWRILREFDRRGLPLTVFAVAAALGRYPELADAFRSRGHEIACHGLRWIHYQSQPEAVERRHVAEATALLRELCDGEAPLGWYTGRDSPNTRRLVCDHGGYAYDSDHYGDDLPFWTTVRRSDGSDAPHLVVPYSLDTNDMRFVQAQGFNTGEHFFAYLRDAFDALWAEGDPAGLDRPKMMSVGMHCRLLGKPGRIGSLQRFLDHVQGREGVWICRRIDVARHWQATHPYDAATAFRWS
jgi:allantoinase